jgi:hypothetical protein
VQDDLELGRVVLQVVAAGAALGGSGGAVNGSTDSAEVILDGLSAALDLTFAATPTTVYAAGRQCNAIISSTHACMQWDAGSGLAVCSTKFTSQRMWFWLPPTPTALRIRAPRGMSVACAGDVIQFNLTGTNTGHLRVRNLALTASPHADVPISCSIGGQLYGPNSSAVLEPSAVGFCYGSYVISTADIEAGPQNMTVSLHGVSSKGDVVAVSRAVLFTPVVIRNITARTVVAQCNRPKQAGERCSPCEANWLALALLFTVSSLSSALQSYVTIMCFL